MAADPRSSLEEALSELHDGLYAHWPLDGCSPEEGREAARRRYPKLAAALRGPQATEPTGSASSIDLREGET